MLTRAGGTKDLGDVRRYGRVYCTHYTHMDGACVISSHSWLNSWLWNSKTQKANLTCLVNGWKNVQTRRTWLLLVFFFPPGNCETKHELIKELPPREEGMLGNGPVPHLAFLLYYLHASGQPARNIMIHKERTWTWEGNVSQRMEFYLLYTTRLYLLRFY